jgi:2-polyprenyl-3-methyl-5-hydroxy-6-metoxy-1,4-benzoquinol methylase
VSPAPDLPDLWRERSSGEHLQAVLDPADRRGRKNRFIDTVHKRALATVMGLEGGQRVLDFGCGVGRLTRWLADQAGTVVGVDSSSEMLAVARSHPSLANIEWVLYEGGPLPFATARFDRVLTVFVLQHVLDAANLASLAAEFARVTRPGGRAILVEQAGGKLVGGYVVRRPPAEYRAVFAAAGFQELAMNPIRVSSRIVSAILGLPLPGAAIEALARVELKTAPWRSRLRHQYSDWLMVFVRGQVGAC